MVIFHSYVSLPEGNDYSPMVVNNVNLLDNKKGHRTIFYDDSL